jgi:hypothetical protein
MQNSTHKILLVLVTLTIIGEATSIILWAVNPTIPSGQKIRFTLAVDYTIAIANAAIFTILNLLALYWIIRRNKKGPIFLIVISIINRLISQPIFIGGIHLIFVSWTALIVIFAFLVYRNQTKVVQETKSS